MRITCPSCESEYAFQDDRIPSRGAKVKCSNCEHVFTIHRPDSGPVLQESSSKKKRKIGKLTKKVLYLRQEGRVYTVRDLSLLQRWVIEKRVLATDEVSADGESWELASRLNQLRAFFAVLRQLRETRRELQQTREHLKVLETREMIMVDAPPVHDDDDEFEAPAVHPTHEVMASMPDEGEARTLVAFAPDDLADAQLDSDEDLVPAGLSDVAADIVEPGTSFSSLMGEHGMPTPSVDDVMDQPVAGPPSDESAGAAEQDFADSWRDLEQAAAEPSDEVVEPESLDQKMAVGFDADGPGAGPAIHADFAEAPADSPAGDPPADEFAAQVEDDPYGEDAGSDEAPSAMDSFFDAGHSDISHEEQVIPGSEDNQAPPIPAGALGAVSKIASEDVVEPWFDPAAQSIIDAPTASPNEPVTAAISEAEEGEGAGEAYEDESSIGRPAVEQPAPGTAAGGDEETLGGDFKKFEDAFAEEGQPDEPKEVWEGDDFGKDYSHEDEEEDGERGPTALPYLIGGAVLIAIIFGGTAYIIHNMRLTTEEQFTSPTADSLASAEEQTPTEVEPTEDKTPADAAEEKTPAEAEPTEPGTPADADVAQDETPTEAEPTTPADDPEEDDGIVSFAAPVEEPTPEPPSDPGNISRALKLASGGQHTEAISEFNKILAASPSNAEAQKGLGWSYIELGNNSRAAEHFRKAVNLNSMDAENHYGLGLSYEGLGRTDDAINEYQTYIGLAPEGREAAEVRILLRRLLEIRDGPAG